MAFQSVFYIAPLVHSKHEINFIPLINLKTPYIKTRNRNFPQPPVRSIQIAVTKERFTTMFFFFVFCKILLVNSLNDES